MVALARLYYMQYVKTSGVSPCSFITSACNIKVSFISPSPYFFKRQVLE